MSTHWYVYVVRQSGCVVFERTCGSLDDARYRVRELTERDIQAVVTNDLVAGALV